MVLRRQRDSARVVVLDESGDVLLVRIVDPFDAKPSVWITPGGGIEPGEHLAQTASRELLEETGLAVLADDFGGPIAVTRGDWEFRGEPLSSEDWFFLHRTSRFEPDVNGQDDLESEIHDAWRWWSIDELIATNEAVLPGGLVGLLHALRAAGGLLELTELPWLVP